ncbi:hypothetical protein DICPUDRAFT_98237 [Dictyostelium purpureum]|uniref:Alpha-mannosidase n=1 Tax=Dictyostelium purpureum TaxID=5786 RepID=F0ZNU5_DICPU|nr:uncharacterized protein DICPUDRAFT_98237 [Dictyostelium purpureum]EGC34354.1 hypothetical protein DICPUDRAFT_98237 [Dictyostelium purpureum]|eukprot:XP_003289088.1 hypothetical protein DICPUDRAFT_98237 [Dictyostelium purpureum]
MRIKIIFLFVILNIIYVNTSKENNDQIQVFLIPHSHSDVGWKQTYNSYYELNVTRVLDNIVATLSKDPTKKFNWAEMVYFERWYSEQTTNIKETVKGLVQDKQLYFVGGGWAQNDEATTDYQAVINQMTLGHQFLLNEFQVKPEIGWQIDPFGPSTLTATLFSLMGFKYHVINRIDERIKYVFNAEQMDIKDSGIMEIEREFEFMWYPSPNNKNLSIFTHVLDHHYSSPFLSIENYLAPMLSYTTGFDFEGPSSQNPPITKDNIKERANLFFQIVQERSALFRHKNLLLPFGGDFRFQNSALEFDNMDRLIEYFNSNPHFGINIKYATLDEYFEAVFNSTAMDQTSNDEPISFPKFSSDDYFVYTQCEYQNYLSSFGTCANYWSGFYSSYAELKQVVRKSDSLLRAAEMLYSLSSSKLANSPFSFDFEDAFGAISRHRNISGILTHHDAVTGTSILAVRKNYMEMLEEVQHQTMLKVMPGAVGFLLANQTIYLDYSCNNTIIDNNPNEGDIYAISFTNSLSWDRYEFVEIEIPESIIVAIYDYDLNPVPSQTVQRMDKNGNWYIYTQIKTPALGISTYFFIITDSSGQIFNKELLYLIEEKIVQKPIISQVIYSNEIAQDSEPITIGNTLFNLNFKFNNYNLLSLNSFDDLQRNELSIPITQNYIEYSSYSDSSYTFRPNGPPVNLKPVNPKYYITNGTLVKIVTIIYTSNCSQSYIVYNSNNTLGQFINEEQYFEIDNIVAAGWNKEVASKFSTNINNNNIFYTSNGLEMMQRQYKVVFGDDEPWSVIAANFFPSINTAQILDQVQTPLPKQLSVLTRQTMGASSQSNGDLELLFVRRSESLGSTLHENMNDISNPLIKVRVLFGDPSNIEQIRTPLSLLLENPLIPVYSAVSDISIDKWTQAYNTLYKPFSESLPYDLHLLTFTKQNSTDSNYFIRLLNIYEVNQGMDSQPIQISINNFFNLFNISNIEETTLSFNSIINIIDDNVSLNPLDLKSFIIQTNKQ